MSILAQFPVTIIFLLVLYTIFEQITDHAIFSQVFATLIIIMIQISDRKLKFYKQNQVNAEKKSTFLTTRTISS